MGKKKSCCGGGGTNSAEGRRPSDALNVATNSSLDGPEGGLETFKVVVVGESGVGKTSLLAALALLENQQNKANDEHDDSEDSEEKDIEKIPPMSAEEAHAKAIDDVQATVGFDLAVRCVRVDQGKVVRLQLWDTAGQERFRVIVKSHFRKSSAALVVFDATSNSSPRSSVQSNQNSQPICQNGSIENGNGPSAAEKANVKYWCDCVWDVCPDAGIVLVGNKIDLCSGSNSNNNKNNNKNNNDINKDKSNDDDKYNDNNESNECNECNGADDDVAAGNLQRDEATRAAWERYAVDELGVAGVVFTSAKTGEGVREAFKMLTLEAVARPVIMRIPGDVYDEDQVIDL